jgi:hypothetical protein
MAKFSVGLKPDLQTTRSVCRLGEQSEAQHPWTVLGFLRQPNLGLLLNQPLNVRKCRSDFSPTLLPELTQAHGQVQRRAEARPTNYKVSV